MKNIMPNDIYKMVRKNEDVGLLNINQNNYKNRFLMVL